MNAAAFLKQAVQHPASTGAVAPSSRRLSLLMVEHARLDGVDSVVELGPGTGAITREILPALDASTRFLGIERNENFVHLLQRNFCRSRFPAAEFIYGDAADLDAHLGHTPCDRVISGLPWAGFSTRMQNQLLSAISSSLCSGGLFLTFAYHPFNRLPRGKSFHRQLRYHFSDVRRTEIVAQSSARFHLRLHQVSINGQDNYGQQVPACTGAGQFSGPSRHRPCVDQLHRTT